MAEDTPKGISPSTARKSASFFGNIPAVGSTREQPREAPAEPEAVEAEGFEEEEAEAEQSVERDDVGEAEESLDTSDKYVVRVDGEEVEVTLDELLSGYSRQADYTRKTQALSAEKKQIEAQKSQASQLASALSQRLQEVESYLFQAVQEPDWAALSKQLSPQEYNQARAVYEQQQRQLDAVRSQQREIMQYQQAEQQRQMEMARTRLPELIPEWSDESVANQEAASIYQFALDTGFSQGALDHLYDPLAVKVLRDAWRYNELQRQKPKIVKRKSPKVAKAGPGMNTKTKRQQQAERALKGPVKAKEASDFFANIKPIGQR